MVCRIYPSLKQSNQVVRQTPKIGRQALPSPLFMRSCEKDQQFAVFEDTPDLFDPESGRGHIRGQVVVKNHELYIERHPGLSFIVYKSYTCCGEDDRTKPRIEAETIPSKESIAIVSYHLVKSLNKVAEISPNRHMYPTFERGRQLHAPYPWVFHDRPFLISCIPDLDYKCQTHLRCFLEDYISQKMDTEYIKVESLLSQGLISVEYMPYLFVSCPVSRYLKQNFHT